MVKRKELEQLLVSIIAPAVMKAQDEIQKKWGFKMEVNIDWHLTKGRLDDDIPEGKAHLIGG